jgi:hypothetical protein
MSNKIDLYFSYWILLYSVIALIYKNITFPFIALLISLVLQFYYINNNINVIINSKKIYIIIGNFLIFYIKYILIIFGILFKNNNYNFITEFKIMLLLFIIFNIYYYINVKKIYYVLTLNQKEIKIDKGPCVYFFKYLLNNL